MLFALCPLPFSHELHELTRIIPSKFLVTQEKKIKTSPANPAIHASPAFFIIAISVELIIAICSDEDLLPYALCPMLSALCSLLFT
jgi:hypothetical protein